MNYRIIKQIMEMGSFTRAAEALNMTQSAVSHAVQGIEREMGFPIFQRLKSGVQLTQEGLRLKPIIESMVIAEDRFYNEVNALNAVQAGTLRVGSFATASSRLLPKIIKAFDARFPDVHIEIIDSDYEDIKKALDEGRIDIAILEEMYMEKNYYKLPYLQDELMVVAPMDFVLDQSNAIKISDIPSHPFIMPDNDQDTFLKQIFKGYNVVPNVKYRFLLYSTVFAMVEAGLGITVVSESAMLKYKFDVQMIPLEPKLFRNVSFVALQSQMKSPIVQAFFNVAKEQQ